MRADAVKLVIAVFLDLLDFSLGRIIGYGTILDVAFAAIAFLLWGPIGLLQLWEALDPTDQIDGFVPTMTLIALTQMRRIGKTKGEER
ncbi:MAG: hypothetical protein GC153_12110 [Alphaproteobacteria bacterium]|nr:hypothetical protein [Alphaproteobacteria bacterium]